MFPSMPRSPGLHEPPTVEGGTVNGKRSVLTILSALLLACQASSACAVRVDAPAPGIEWKEGHLVVSPHVGRDPKTNANHHARVRKPGPPGLGACTAIQQQRTRQPPSLVASNSAQPATPAARHANGVSYLSGSADRDDAIDMQGAAVFYNVCLAFSGKERAWIAGVQAQIYRHNGLLVFKVYADGPFILIRLKPGRYRIVANYDGRVIATKLAVPKHGATARMLWWPDLAHVVV